MSAQQDDQRQSAGEGQWPDAETDAGAGQAALALSSQVPASPETDDTTSEEYAWEAAHIRRIWAARCCAVCAARARPAGHIPSRPEPASSGRGSSCWQWRRYCASGTSATRRCTTTRACTPSTRCSLRATPPATPTIRCCMGHSSSTPKASCSCCSWRRRTSSMSAGRGNNPWINDTTARIVPALFGLGIVALPLGLRRELGRLGALLAALLLAVSPAFVYFSRFLREDIYFNFFMFAMVVCAVRFAASRSAKWLALTIASTVLAYATFEGVFLTLAIFVSFLAILVAWELAGPLSRLIPATFEAGRRLLLGRVIALLALAGIGAAAAAWGLRTMKTLSAYIQANTKVADVQVAQLEQRTVVVLLYLSIGIAALVILSLLWQITRENALYDLSPATRRRSRGLTRQMRWARKTRRRTRPTRRMKHSTRRQRRGGCCAPTACSRRRGGPSPRCVIAPTRSACRCST